MLYIEKNSEPRELTEAKRKGLQAYDAMSSDTKKSIKEALLHEQGFLCAYCMQRVDLKSSTIEHFIPQNPTNGEANDALSIDYNNMLAVCGGNTQIAKRKNDLICDKHRGNTFLTADPRNIHIIEKISYRDDGTIYSTDANIKRDLNETLNLNCETALLKQNRKSVLDAVKSEILKKCLDKTISKRQLENILLKMREARNGKYIPFCGIAIWYLQKKLARF